MSLQLPCEVSVKEILPAVRSIVAEKLVKERNMSEYKVASIMGLTPAAVSNYIKSKRGSGLRYILEKDPKFMKILSEVVDRIASNNTSLAAYYCILCSEGKKVLNKNGYNLAPCYYESV